MEFSSIASENMPAPAFFKFLWAYGVVSLLFCKWVDGCQDSNAIPNHNNNQTLMVDLTLVHGAAAKGAVCLDGTLPGYHIHRGYGSSANNWLIMLEGGGWCNTTEICVARKKTPHGSSAYMQKQMPFTAILSNKAGENPDFFNWNRVLVRYCDGASFSGDSQDEAAQVYYRGQRIWSAVMEDLKSKGMHDAKQALLTGCSSGGLAAILHCDGFGKLFPMTTRVKCLSDAGLFLDVIDISGFRSARHRLGGVVTLQRVRNLPRSCTKRLNPILCYFPQYWLASIKTPLFIVNAAYDPIQVWGTVVPVEADPLGRWSECRHNYTCCSASQIQVIQGFRNQMLNAVRGLTRHKRNGVFINSCFTHCQTVLKDIWFDQNAPRIKNKTIAEYVGDWYFDGLNIQAIDCPYPCDSTCHNVWLKRDSIHTTYVDVV